MSRLLFQFAVPSTLTIFSHRVTVVRVLGSKFLLYHFGIKAVIILKYHGALIEPVYPIKEPASLSPWRLASACRLKHGDRDGGF